MREEDEVKLYYKICEIAKICKKYFYVRKYLPKDAWSIDKVIEYIYQSSKELKSKYNEIKKNNE